MSLIFIIRHAQASFGKDNYDRLSPRGLEQARILGDHLERTGRRFDAVYAGAMNRQTETAEIALSRLRGAVPGIRSSSPFNEYDSLSIIQSQIPGMMEADPSVSDALSRVYEDRRAFQKILEGAMNRWISGEHDRAGVESWASFKRRVREGMHSVMEENGRGKVLAIFTSGGPLSVAMQMALGLSDRETLQLGWQIVNTSVSTFKYNLERLTLESFNGVAHLELTGDQKLITYR